MLTENPVPDNPRRAYIDDLNATQRASQEAMALFRVVEEENGAITGDEDIETTNQDVTYPKLPTKRNRKTTSSRKGPQIG